MLKFVTQIISSVIHTMNAMSIIRQTRKGKFKFKTFTLLIKF